MPESSSVETVMWNGRLTWTECKLFEALVASRVNMQKAGDTINDVVKGFGNAKITAQHINTTLWSNCQKVNKGQPAV